MKLCSVLYASLDGREVGARMNTYICMAESLHCSPETTTTLLICFTPKQNVFVVKKYVKKRKKFRRVSHTIKFLLHSSHHTPSQTARRGPAYAPKSSPFFNEVLGRGYFPFFPFQALVAGTWHNNDIGTRQINGRKRKIF